MSAQFTVDSIDYLADKWNRCPDLSEESLAYLASQTTGLIVDLLQDACKVVRKCRRKAMTTKDFQFALNLHGIEPMYGGYTSSIGHDLLFRRVKKHNRVLHQIDDNIIELDRLMTCDVPLPLDISLRTHWLAVAGKQPAVNENPIVDERRALTRSHRDFNRTAHLLAVEQQIYYREITEMCICSHEQKRQEALLLLSSDGCLQQIVARLVLFISEGIRVNLATGTCNRSATLKSLLEMSHALLNNETLSFERHLHHLLPAILSCLLERRASSEHWSLRDLAARCSRLIIQRYSTAANRLQQRTIDIFYRILVNECDLHTWPTQYGALIGLCEMGHKVIIQMVFPLIKRLGDEIRSLADDETSKKITDVVVKHVTIAYRSLHNHHETNENKLNAAFGSYFAPLIQHQLILLL